MSEIQVFKPAEIGLEQWQELHDLARTACEHAFHEEVDVDAYVSDFERFHVSHLDPNVEVGRRYNANQAYYGPRVAVVHKGNEPAGWMYVTRHNVSGGGLPGEPHDKGLKARAERALRLGTTHDYFWLREEYVDPAYQHRGMATGMFQRLAKEALPWQPMSVYLYPDLYKPGALSYQHKAQELGFRITREVVTPVPGIGNTKMLRLQADRAVAVRRKLNN